MNRLTFTALGSAALAASPLRAFAQSAPAIRMGTVPVESYALPYYARDANFFAKAGLNVEVMSFSGGGAITAGVAGGALDVGCANVGSLANAHARGVPIRLIAPGGLYSSAAPTTVLAVARNSSITSVKELSGKTVGVSTLKDLQQASVMRTMQAAGGDPQSIKFIELPIPAIPAALAAGRLDAGIMLEPHLTFSKDQIRVLVPCYDAIAKTFMISAFFSTDAWLRQNGALALKLVDALQDAAQWANKNQSSSGAILEKVSKLPPGGAARMNRIVFGEKLQASLVQPVIDALAEYAYLPAAFPAADEFWTGKT